MLYLYLVIDLDNKYNWKNFYKYLDNIIDYFDILISLLRNKEINQIVNKYKKALESNTTIEKKKFDKIEQQLSSINLFQEKIEEVKKYTILNWTKYYNNFY